MSQLGALVLGYTHPFGLGLPPAIVKSHCQRLMVQPVQLPHGLDAILASPLLSTASLGHPDF